ncbi:hypothetical protein [Halobacterium sp. CBA1126]|uniref:hypothetical protein n=1 Tax=Halobacterium TaxID=2239 RepID=UPI0012FA66FB|nr:hypothetical protein [Halobacterium sp. CBA1126]MUV59500.1 hypothetical protein [Halobacterium sp. CBA1126]
MAEKRDSDEVVSSYPFASDDADAGESFVCEDCEREFDSRRGLNIHRGQQHEQGGE